MKPQIRAFLVPLAGLQRSVRGDASSRQALTPYTLYVLIYDGRGCAGCGG